MVRLEIKATRNLQRRSLIPLDGQGNRASMAANDDRENLKDII
jgi:hypothetical protein